LWFPEQVVAVLADAVEPRKYALVVDTLALDVKEVGTFAEGVVEHQVARRGRSASELEAAPRGARQHRAHQHHDGDRSRNARSGHYLSQHKDTLLLVTAVEWNAASAIKLLKA
jgi:hypothetical protein